jgi:ribonuclease BN (tRNA processing enzyme)
MKNITFTILGSSSGMPQGSRLSSGYVLQINDSLYQFDCGGGISTAFRQARFNPLDVEAIFISHTHPDHISDLPLYIQMQYLVGRSTPIDIYLPEEAVADIKAYFRSLYLLPEKLPFNTNFIPIGKSSRILLDELNVTPIANSHLNGYQELIAEYDLPHQMQCFSFLIKVNRKSILYSADLGSEKDLIPYLKNLDLLVIESTHINIANLFDAIIDNDVRKVILTHIDDSYDPKEALDLALKNGIDNLFIAEDGMRVSLYP